MTTPSDRQRFAALVDQFIADSNFAPPYWLIVIGSDGSADIVRYGELGAVEHVCGRSENDPPVTAMVLAIVTPDGGGRSVKVTIEPRPAIQ